MRIDKQEKGALIVFVSAPVSPNDPGAGEDEVMAKEDLQESSGYKELNSLIEQLTQCAITNRLYQRRTRIKMDLRAPFEDVDDLNSILSCGAQQFERPVVSFERHDGFLWNTYITQFEITQRTQRCGGESDCSDSETFMPRVVILTVPGRVDRIKNGSDLVGFAHSSRQVDDDTIRLEVRQLPAEQYRAANLNYFKGRREEKRDDVLRVRIESAELNYNLNTLISVIGVIFGSGLLIQLARRFLFRTKDEKQAAPAVKARAARRAKSPTAKSSAKR